MNRAVLLDRDGTVVELLYGKETGYIDSPARPSQIRLIPGAAGALKRLKAAGYKLILVSNQPGVAKGRMTKEEFDASRGRFGDLLAEEGVRLDGEYYCLHHPNAAVQEYRRACDCRKPKPGMILDAARDHSIDLAGSFVVGDDLNDVRAGAAAGCRTVLISHVTGLLLDILEGQNLRPDAVKGSLAEAADWLLSDSGDRPRLRQNAFKRTAIGRNRK